jgi:hypothetical protein
MDVAALGRSDCVIADSAVCDGSYLNSVPQTGQFKTSPGFGWEGESILAAQLGQ